MVNETGPNDNTAATRPVAGAATRRGMVGWHADRLARWAAIALGASIPVSTALDNVLLALIVLGWLASAGFRAKWATIRVTWTSLVVFATVVLAALGLTYTLATTADAMRMFDKHLTLLLIPILLSLAWTDRERDLAIKAFAFSMLVVLVLSWGLAAGLVPPGSVVKGVQSNAYVFKLHITHNYLMAFAVFLYAAYSRAASGRAVRVAWALASLAALVNVGFMVQGRTGYVVVLVLALVVLGYRHGWRGTAAAVVGGTVLVVGAYAGSSTFRLRIDQAGTEWVKWQAGETRASGGVFDRLNFFANTWRIIEAHPVLGVGTGGFSGSYRAVIAGTGHPVTRNPHNQYLLAMAELGVAGLALLLALFYAAWRDSWRLRDDRDRLIVHTLLAAIAVTSLVNSMLLDHAETLFFAWGCGVALAGRKT